MADEQRQAILTSSNASRSSEFIPEQERNIFDRHLHAQDPEHGFDPYLRAEGEELYSFLRLAWQQASVPFYTDEEARHTAGDYVPQV